MSEVSFENVSETLQKMKTLLSISVADIITVVKCSKFDEILTVNGFIEWSKWDKIVRFSEYSRESADYRQLVEDMAPAVNTILCFYGRMPYEQFIAVNERCFLWTNSTELLFRIFQLLQDNSDTSTVLATQVLTAVLERALTNVYLTRNKNVPYLLKDLLSTNELKDIFGVVPMAVLDIILGSPTSLNIRNILWHGFVSPGEIDRRYGYLLVSLIASLGVKLHEKNNICIPHQSYITFEKAAITLQAVFSDFEEKEMWLQYIFEHTGLIFNPMRIYWTTSLSLYRERRYGMSLAFLVPQLESCLRVIYALVNNCPHQVLTAEPDSRYVTLTEIFSEFLPDGSLNLFKSVVSEGEMELLLDIFVHPEGPRVRDRLSHGEVDFCEVPKILVKHVLFVAATICLKCMPKDSKLHYEDFTAKLKQKSICYEPFYHSTSFTKAKVISFSLSLKKWRSCKYDVSEVFVAEKAYENDFISHIIAAICKIYQLENSISTRWISFADGLDLLENTISKCVLHTVHRPKVECEITTLLRQIGHHSEETSENVLKALNTFNTMWNNKTLRSRQRSTYVRLLSSIHILYGGLRIILILLTAHVLRINEMNSYEDRRLRNMQKSLKLSLKYVENLSIMTNRTANKWTECVARTDNFMLKLDGCLKTFESWKFPP